jgi:two-component system response regulator YesN
MRTLLIADDERNIRLGLQAMIEREFPGAYRIMLAADGKQALHQYEREPADILITDIRMPEMDGIALIRELAERPGAPAVIILSGYDDFQYAKEAIKHKVREYLLKPIVREDLFAMLRRIEEEFTREEAIQGRLNTTDRYREAMRVRTLEYLFARADIGTEEIRSRCLEAGLDEFEPSYCLGIFDPLREPRIRIKGQEYLSGHTEDGTFLSLEDKDGRLVVLTSRPEHIRALSDFLTASCGKESFAAGISEEGREIGEVKTKYEEARHALKYRLLSGRSDPALLQYSQLKHRDRSCRVPEEAIRKLANMLGTGREKEMKALLLEMFEPKRLAEADISYFEGVSQALNEWVFDQIFRTYGEASVEIIKMYKLAGSLYHFASIQDYIHNVEGLLLGLNDYIRDLKNAHFDQKEIARAVQYIHEQYDKDLSMTIVSNHVSLNYSYFSERFKEYTGVSFIPYLKRVRIDKAKELLARSDLRIHEIAARVGYENPKQFNRVFREAEGITPMEYRMKL